MKPMPTLAAAALAAATLAACGGTSTSTADSAPPTHPASLRASRSPSPSPAAAPASPTSSSGSGNAGGTTTTLDPCQVVPQDEASALAHTTFAAGHEEAGGGSGQSKECVYGAQTSNVLTVVVVQSGSQEAAQAGWDQLLAEAEQKAGPAAQYVTLSDQAGLADRAEWVELDLPQVDVSGRGLALLHGAVGVYVIDLVRGGSAPTRDDFTQEALKVLSRLP
jgi:hypothetical protein